MEGNHRKCLSKERKVSSVFSSSSVLAAMGRFASAGCRGLAGLVWGGSGPSFSSALRSRPGAELASLEPLSTALGVSSPI